MKGKAEYLCGFRAASALSHVQAVMTHMHLALAR